MRKVCCLSQERFQLHQNLSAAITDKGQHSKNLQQIISFLMHNLEAKTEDALFVVILRVLFISFFLSVLLTQFEQTNQT